MISRFVAWWLWRTIYLLNLPRLEKKLRVALDWTLDVAFSKDFVQYLHQPSARVVNTPIASSDFHPIETDPHRNYLDATPSYSYAKALYKYPQCEFPYRWLVEENRRRGILGAKFELTDTGVFDKNSYFDIQVERSRRRKR